MNVIQEGQVQGLANHESFAFCEVNSAAVVGLFESLQELVRHIIRVIGAWSNLDCLPGTDLARLVWVLLSELRGRARHAGRKFNGCHSDHSRKEDRDS